MPPAQTSLIVVFGLMATCLRAQEAPLFSTAADLVVLNVRVTDRKDAHVAGLTREAFAVTEEGRAQTVSLFASEDMPVTVGLVIDSSISMWAIRDRLIAGAIAFTQASNPLDEVFALAFNERIWPALPPSAPFTSDVATLRDALASVVHPRGQTAVFDAISAGLNYADRGTHLRKVLVVISDGGDNASRATFDEVIARTQASNVVIYAVALVDPVDREANPKRLERLARVSGGEMFEPRTVDQVTETLQHVAGDIRHSYSLGYTPPGPADGKYRRLRVTVASPRQRGLVVRTRDGYLAGPVRSRSDRDPR